MAEHIRFLSPEEKREKETVETLKEEGGVFYREESDLETGEKKGIVNVLGVEVETYAYQQEEIKEILNNVVFSELDQKLLHGIAECYSLRQPLMLEGDPGVGKTFLMEKFVKLIHGKEAPILKIVGTPRTSELEILGHWAPAGKIEDVKDPVARDAIKRYSALEKEYREAGEEFDKIYLQAKKRLKEGEINRTIFEQEIESLQKWYHPVQERYATELELLFQKTKEKVEWEFKEGALLQSYSGREGQGYVLICDEFNLIPSNYQQIFLQIGGEEGHLSESISFWGNSGKTIYKKGKDTAIFFASNYPEKTPGRSEVVAPMTDRLVWRTISSEEAQEKKRVIKRTAGGRLKKRTQEMGLIRLEKIDIPAESQLVWNEILDGVLGEQLADVVDILDSKFVENYEKIGDRFQGEAGRRTQQMEFSARNALRLYSYLDHFQVRDSKTGLIDFTATLKNAFEKYYLNRLVGLDLREDANSLFQEILVGPTGETEFEGKVITRKEIFDILVERASQTKKEETPEEIENKKVKEELRELADFRDSLEEDLEELRKEVEYFCREKDE